jgi:hypothetical protein
MNKYPNLKSKVWEIGVKLDCEGLQSLYDFNLDEVKHTEIEEFEVFKPRMVNLIENSVIYIANEFFFVFSLI